MQLGIDVLLQGDLSWLAGKRVGLITNPSGATRDLQSAVDALYKHPGIQLKALYAPEHGIRGDRPGGEHITGYVDPKTGLPVYSLYGATWKPTPEMLRDIDVLMFNIQDVGSDLYTYIYTLAKSMEAAAENGKEFVVLDRPNPIGGLRVEGPLRKPNTVAYQGRYLLPTRHGMTIGELATMWNEEFHMGVSLRVIKIKGWERWMHWADTGLQWVLPSPAMPTADAANLYAGTVFLEMTNASVGRESYKPFQLVGASWLPDAEPLATSLNARGLAGLYFRPAYYTSGDGTQYAGVEIHLIDPHVVDLAALAVQLMDAFHSLAPTQFRFPDGFLGDSAVGQQLKVGVPAADVMAGWQSELQHWIQTVRNRYLLYPPYPEGVVPYEWNGSISIRPMSLTLTPGEKRQLQVTGLDRENRPFAVEMERVEWRISGGRDADGSGSDEDATVSDGTATPLLVTVDRNGILVASNAEGTGTLTAVYGPYTATVPVSVQKCEVRDIRTGEHPGYTRIVFDLNRNTDVSLNDVDGALVLRFAAETAGNLLPGGGVVVLNGSPFVERIEYASPEPGLFEARLILRTAVKVAAPQYSNRIVLDISAAE